MLLRFVHCFTDSIKQFQGILHKGQRKKAAPIKTPKKKLDRCTMFLYKETSGNAVNGGDGNELYRGFIRS